MDVLVIVFLCDDQCNVRLAVLHVDSFKFKINLKSNCNIYLIDVV